MSNILIVDDEKVVIELYSRVLMMGRHTVELFMSAEEALPRILKDPRSLDLIISDVDMLTLNGINFAYKLKRCEETQTIPILLNSGGDFGRYSDELKELSSKGNFGYTAKPVSIEILLACANNPKSVSKYKEYISKNL